MSTDTDRITLRRPDDWHVHLRDGAMLKRVVDATARQFARAIVMPNLDPPVITTADADAYRSRIVEAVGPEHGFEPLMTAYLTEETDPDDIARGHAEGVLTACKLYPANATTNSARGVRDMAAISAVLERMQEIGMPLLIHGEVVGPEIDVFDREALFIEQVLAPLLDRFPALKVVLEHITTADAVDFVASAREGVAATITAHHLRLDRNAMFDGGLRPHAYCLPVAKRARHRDALRRAATSGSWRFFLGTDSAPHLRADKESDCGCAGIFSAPVAIESYATTFEEEGALAHLERFASEAGPRFYGLPVNTAEVVLVRDPWPIPARLGDEPEALVPFHAGEQMPWRLAEDR